MTDGISKEGLKNTIKRLEDAFSTRIPKARLMALYDALKGRNIEHVDRAVTYLINNKPYMPINSDIVIAVSVEAEKSWQEKKNLEKSQAVEFFKPSKHARGLARDAITCINKMLDLPLNSESKAKKVALMLEMEEKYPNIGYKEEAMKMKRTWDKHEINQEEDVPF